MTISRRWAFFATKSFLWSWNDPLKNWHVHASWKGGIAWTEWSLAATLWEREMERSYSKNKHSLTGKVKELILRATSKPGHSDGDGDTRWQEVVRRFSSPFDQSSVSLFGWLEWRQTWQPDEGRPKGCSSCGFIFWAFMTKKKRKMIEEYNDDGRRWRGSPSQSAVCLPFSSRLSAGLSLLKGFVVHV